MVPVARPILTALVLLTIGMVAAAHLAAAEQGGLIVDPAELRLVGVDARWTLLVDQQTTGGRRTNVSEDVQFSSSNPAVCTVSQMGEVVAKADGSATIHVRRRGTTAEVPVVAHGTQTARTFNFGNDIIPLLSRYSCNYSGCHGKAEGQNGFKLSVFGFDPQADYDALTKESRGRRMSLSSPQQSLVLLKASGRSPHGGGLRIAPQSRDYQLLSAWIADGAPFGKLDDPKVERIRIDPRERSLQFQDRQRLRVVARYSDGREVDVTSLARFQSNNESIASVDETGLVTAGQTPGQVAIMASFASQVDVFTALVPRAEQIDTYANLPEHNFIDRLVHEKLRRLNVLPSGRCDDATFVRRATLDVAGRLPTAAEARAFLADTHANKRARWVDRLLASSEFADYWALQWADLLRVDRQVLGHKLAYDYYWWIRASLAAGQPLDEFARELLTADGPLAEVPQGAFFKVISKPGVMASTVAQVFLGVRIACAECHHHPFDRWSQQDYYGMTAFFAQVGSKTSPLGEAVTAIGEPVTKHPRTGLAVVAHALGEAEPSASPAGDRRLRLAEWVTSAANPWFAANLANRVWAHLLGRGLVEPVDDMRATNPPSNPELLAALGRHLVDNRFDLRTLISTIMASAAYQRSATPNYTNERDEQNYSRAVFKRLDAEVLLDAVNDTLGVPEKFPGTPSGMRAVQLWDSRVNDDFLRLFGRPLRTTTCTCERSAEPNVSQVLHLLNSPELQAKLEHSNSRIRRLCDSLPDDRALVDELYLTFFARHPSQNELRVGVEYLRLAQAGRQQATQDLSWSLLNTLEFVFNH